MDNKDAEILLEKYNSGIAKETERALVETWYIKYQPKESLLTETQLVYDKRKSLTQLLEQIGKRRKWVVWRAAAAVAAVLAIGMTVLMIYLNPVIKNKQKEANYVNDVAAGGNRATLLLGNGKRIDLSSAGNGVLAEQTGVKISKSKDGKLVYTLIKGKSTRDAVVQYNTIETPNGGQYQVNLPDGTNVYLNAASSIRYPMFFKTNERKVEIKGEAYFEVAHNKQAPFRVVSAGQVVEVLGTHFNVSAYGDQETIETTLLEGSIRLTDHGKSKLLIPGQQAAVSASGIAVKTDVNTADVIAWKNGYFVFNENLKSIMNKISRWYDVEIVYQTDIDPGLEFGGKISRAKKLSSALKIIALTGNVHFKIEGRRVIVMR